MTKNLYNNICKEYEEFEKNILPQNAPINIDFLPMSALKGDMNC